VKVGKGIGALLIEGGFIVVSVLLGFAVAQYGERRADRELAQRALSGLQAELEFNLALVEPYVAFHRAHVKTLQPHVVFDGAAPEPAVSGLSGFQLFLRTRPPLPPNVEADSPLVRRAAWDAAASSGALRLIDYDLIASLSSIYQMQEHLAEAAARVPVTSTAFFDPREALATVRQARAALAEVAWAEESLVKLYRQHLPAVRAAAEDR
jgi:hypothetical protein